MPRSSIWAIFAELTEAKWYFGDLTPEFIENTVKFLNGLDGIGQELFGSGVASIVLDQRSKKTITASEIFVVSLYGTFFFIAADPLITIRLLDIIKIPEIMNDQMRGVLSGQAAVLYANLYMSAENPTAANHVDELFQSAIYEIGITEDIDKIIEKGRCSFAGFTLVELLLFHYQLRKIFAETYRSTKPWAILADESGAPIHINFGQITNATSLAGYLSVLYLFCTELFAARPKSMVFGGDSLIPLEVVNGKTNLLSVSQWNEVFVNPDFIRLLSVLDKSVLDDILGPLAEFLAEKLTLTMKKSISDWSIFQLIHIYTNMPKYMTSLFNESQY